MSSPAPRARFFVPLPRGRVLSLGERTAVMAIINVTPDSFSDGGRRLDPAIAIADAERLIAQGADLIDIGGESTRPGAEPVSPEEEWRRIRPVLEGVRRISDLPISIDTYKAIVAERAIDCGADIINDISALTYDSALAEVIARRGASVILMHNRGRSSDMYARADYQDVVGEVVRELGACDEAAQRAGIASEKILVDPGLGFAKRAHHSMAALAGLPALATLGRPIVSGPSRKSFLTDATGQTSPDARLWGTAAAVAVSVILGAHVVRVHDVAEMKQVARVVDALVRGAGVQG